MQSRPAIILAGGLGTRLRSVDPTRPKPMVIVNGKPFLHWLVLHLSEAGFNDFILSTGYKAEVIEDYPWKRFFPDGTFAFSRETQPLGTGGAVSMIFKTTPELNEAWVINGDTILAVPLRNNSHRNEVHYTALVESEVFDAKPNLHVQGSRVVKVAEGGTLFDGGQVYVKREAIARYSGKIPVGLHELLAPAMKAGQAGFSLTQGTCYDIGTPERLQRFEQYLHLVYPRM